MSRYVSLILCFFGILLFAGEKMIVLDPQIVALGGNVRGFGILAEYPAGGPKEIRLTRDAKDFAAKPSYHTGWSNIGTLRVFDPNGKMTAHIDLGLQKKQIQDYVLSVPEGPAGIWRFSVTSGSSDNYTIAFPDTKTWGVRGEMALGTGKRFPKNMYLYVPETAEKLIVEVFPFHRKLKLPILADGKEISDYSKQPNQRRFFTVIDKIPQGKVLSFDLSKLVNGGGFAIDGMPGLLCPTPEAALKLKGGLHEVGGSLLCGPLQARARQYMLKMKPEDFKVDLNFPDKTPMDLKNPQTECLLFGKYGNLGMLRQGCEKQITDTSKLQAGLSVPPEKRGALTNRRNFLNNSLGAFFDAAALSCTASIPTRMNAGFQNKGLINRAVIAAFSNVVILQGDDLLREGDFRTTNYPITHVFFAYDSLAKGFSNLQPLLDPEARDIWRDAVIALGDKCGTYMAYVSNQWADVLAAHLHVYMATGEVRFRRYFEIQMNAYLDTHFTASSKHGQHPAGYFLEDYGPDGNYDHLNLFSVVSIWHKYTSLKDADPVLAEKLKRGIQKNLEFKKFFWVPEGGCPTALNNRTLGVISNPSWPGHYMARNDFDLAYTHHQLQKMPESGIGGAGTFAHLANSDEWALRVINWDLAQKGSRWSGLGCHWTRELYEAYRRPLKAKKVRLPYEAEHGLWSLPGFAAWKNAGIYGLVFADVDGADASRSGITSGGPLGLWSNGPGWFLNGIRNPKRNEVSEPADITWSAVVGTLPSGKLFASGKEKNSVATTKDRIEINGKLKENAGDLSWIYRLSGDKTELKVELRNSSLKDAFLLLPFQTRPDAELTLSGSVLSYKRGGRTVKISFAPAVKAELLPAKAQGYSTQLKLKFPADGVLNMTFQLN